VAGWGAIRMAASRQYEVKQGNGSKIDRGFSGQPPLFAAHLRNTLSTIPGHTWYAAPSGELAFVNERCADYLGPPNDHSLRLGIHRSADWDSIVPFLHPDDREKTVVRGRTFSARVAPVQ